MYYMKVKVSILVLLSLLVLLLCSFAFNNYSVVVNKGYVLQSQVATDALQQVKKRDVPCKTVAKRMLLQEMKGLKFDTLDLNGKQVTSEIFKQAKVTMVNIWATWCPPCRAELPDIGNLARKYKAKGCQVLAICSDVTEEDVSSLQEAKEIIKNAECDKVIVLRNNHSLDSVYEQIRAFPTTIFFDANGNVIAPIIVGGRSEEAFAKVFDDCLKKVK